MAGHATKKLVIKSDLAEAVRVVCSIIAETEAHGYDDAARFAIRLALDEAVANAIKHGNGNDPNRRVAIEYAITAKHVRISVTDEGSGFNPKAIPDPTLDENLERPNGRGVMLMKAYMSKVEYNHKGNCVTMVKERKSHRPQSNR